MQLLEEKIATNSASSTCQREELKHQTAVVVRQPVQHVSGLRLVLVRGMERFPIRFRPYRFALMYEYLVNYFLSWVYTVSTSE
ncbi:hypothetical protein E2C01_038713 [Portunus trituberculatus]|uniref:Uncharacterized protein n=1 Tax=Portunus trituberculatus TaxID=210409 RepID=A0A5B7FBJ1_PORTR|nr:hypothetical protein [Portunus trituberculatus]